VGGGGAAEAGAPLSSGMWMSPQSRFGCPAAARVSRVATASSDRSNELSMVTSALPSCTRIVGNSPLVGALSEADIGLSLRPRRSAHGASATGK